MRKHRIYAKQIEIFIYCMEGTSSRNTIANVYFNKKKKDNIIGETSLE